MSNISSVIKSIQDVMRQDSGVDGDAQRISQLTWLLFLKVFDAQEEELELTRDRYQSPIPEPLRWRNWATDAEGITGDTLLEFVNGQLFPKLKAIAGDAERNPRGYVVRSVFEDAFNYMKSGQLLRQIINKLNAIDFNRQACSARSPWTLPAAPAAFWSAPWSTCANRSKTSKTRPPCSAACGA